LDEAGFTAETPRTQRFAERIAELGVSVVKQPVNPRAFQPKLAIFALPNFDLL